MIKVEVKYILKPNQRENFYNAIISQGIDVAAKNEEGNVKYDFDIPDEKDILYLQELWKDEAALTAHGTMHHYKALAELKAKYVTQTLIDKEIITDKKIRSKCNYCGFLLLILLYLIISSAPLQLHSRHSRQASLRPASDGICPKLLSGK